MKQQQEEIDQISVDELYLYAINDGELYHRIHEPYVRNYANKMKKDAYYSELALRGIYNNYVPQVIRKYRKEFGLADVNRASKTQLARELLNRVVLDIEGYHIGLTDKFVSQM